MTDKKGRVGESEKRTALTNYMTKLIKSVDGYSRAWSSLSKKLTQNEIEIVKRYVNGYPISDIDEMLCLRTGVVKMATLSAYNKLIPMYMRVTE